MPKAYLNIFATKFTFDVDHCFHRHAEAKFQSSRLVLFATDKSEHRSKSLSCVQSAKAFAL